MAEMFPFGATANPNEIRANPNSPTGQVQGSMPSSPSQQPATPAGQSVLMQALGQYLKGNANAAGDPNASSPSLASALTTGIGNQIDNSTIGRIANMLSGNSGQAQGPNADGSAGINLPGLGSQLMSGIGSGLSSLADLFG